MHLKHRTVKLIPLALLLLILAVASSFAAQEGVVQETTLSNGLKVLTKEVHSAPVFNLSVWYRLGSRNENIGQTGMTHLLEHMLFKGTKNYKKGEITSLIRKRGGIDNGATWLDFTNFWELMSSEHLDLALKIEADRMTSVLIDPDEFKSEMVVVRSELEGKENDPGTLLYKELNAVAYKEHPYRWPVIGWRTDVEGVTRDEVFRCYKDYYGPNNAVLVLVGDFDTDKALAFINKRFGRIRQVKEPRPVRAVEPPQSGEKRVELHGKGNAHRVVIAYHAVSASDPDSYPLAVADQVLSGGRSSRLYQALVEKGLAVSAWSSVTPTRDPSLFTVGAVGQKDVTAEQLEAALLSEVEKLKNDSISDEELQRAKNQIEAYFVFNKDSVSDQADQIGFFEIVGSWKLIDEYVPRIRAVTKEDVQRVARKYFTDLNRTIARFIPAEPGLDVPAAPPNGPAHYSRPLVPARSLYRAPEARTWSGVEGPESPRHPKGNPSTLNAQLSTRHYSAISHQPSAVLGIGCWVLGSDTQHLTPNTQHLALSTINHQPSTRPRVNPFRAVLKNGLVVIVHENHSNSTVAINGSLNAGSYFDPPGKNGVAKMVARMLERGTQRRSSLEIAKGIEFVGASTSVEAEVESVRFSGSALTKDFELVMDVLSDMLRNPSFPEDQLQKLRGETISRLRQEHENPEAMAERTFNNKLFPEGHPYHALTTDQAIKSIEQITRDDLVAFHKNHYGPNGAIIVIVGDVTAQSAAAAVEEYFGDWPASESAAKVIVPDTPLPEKSERVIVDIPEKPEAAILFGHPCGITRSSPDFYAYAVMNQMLGGGGALGSILGNRIRDEMGLAYDVYSTFDATLGEGAWYASIGCNPANVGKATAALVEEVKDYIASGPSKQGFEEAKKFIIGFFPVRLETNAGVARVLLNAEFYGLGMDYIENYPRLYHAVIWDQVREVAKKYLHPDKALLVIAGPTASRQQAR